MANAIFYWPINQKDIVRTKTYPDGITQRFGSKHGGLDIDTNNDPKKYPTIYPIQEGEIIEWGYSSVGYGFHVIVRHGEYESLYGHFDRIYGKRGDWVDIDTPLGLAGTTGKSTGPHLHLEIRKAGIKIDPLPLLILREIYMSKLEDIEKRLESLETRLKFDKIAQVSPSGEVLVAPEFRTTPADSLILSVLRQYSGHGLIPPSEGKRLKAEGWVTADKLPK